MVRTKADRFAAVSSKAGLGLLYLISLASVAGFGIFRTWPGLLVTIPDAAAVYPRAFAFFPRAQIIAAFVVLAAYLAWRVRARWIAGFAAVYAISLGSELAGTTVGLPFGPYRYTDALGAMWFGHVPILIPISWFMMALPSFALAGEGVSRARRIVVGSLILLAWDLSLDPAMSAATAFWVWGTPGAYYGMPWLNLLGWFVTGVALMMALTALDAERWTRGLSKPWLLGFYGANLSLPIGLAIVAGMWGAVVVSALAVGACWVAASPKRIPGRAFA